MSIIELYACPICIKDYKTRELAQECYETCSRKNKVGDQEKLALKERWLKDVFPVHQSLHVEHKFTLRPDYFPYTLTVFVGYDVDPYLDIRHVQKRHKDVLRELTGIHEILDLLVPSYYGPDITHFLRDSVTSFVFDLMKILQKQGDRDATKVLDCYKEKKDLLEQLDSIYGSAAPDEFRVWTEFESFFYLNWNNPETLRSFKERF